VSKFILASGLFITAIAVMCLFTPVKSGAGILMGDIGVSEGVYCEINEVKMFAQSAEDCEKAGGMVTHTVTKEVKAADDNPNEEPEIQRTKDKEPEAP